ncbi:acetylxylan esterase [Mucilaginibacter pallidiroseus]|uniref:Acetylxylan esterase n=1 Tax=Mucilaginibacter pallidiroseus TaxID=2599295 RepID=A0A563UG78_9SPHI|nr:acetylxylan esterase [Mucilaginibacter pallidiroseus]TWR30351.1 acetylxylan esterase [Mucilaginibacter pallidiroseus]
MQLSKSIKFCLLSLGLVMGACYAVSAQNEEKEISTVLTAGSKNAIFSNNAKYTFEVKNPTGTEQTGTVSYVISQHNKNIDSSVVKVKIGKHSSEKYSFDMPAFKAGFYKVNFMVNITEYDDTTRRVFGIRPEEIRSQYPKPADFDAFWQKAKDELAQVKPQFKVTPMPKLNTSNRNVYAIEMKSLDNMTIRGWMTVPMTKSKSRKFSVLLGLPGYQVNLSPIVGNDEDLAIITLNVRGQGNSRGPIDTRRDEFIFYRVEDRDNYVMRGVIMDCLRGVDFIFSRPELKHDNILVSGGSMGGWLAMATASLDKRVNLCSTQNPILCDVYNLDGEVTWPIRDIKKYVRTQPGLTLKKVLDNLAYYDGKNFAYNIKCPLIMGIGLLDPYAPPAAEYATYNVLTDSKRIMVFKDLGHEISQSYKELEGRWMRDTFALF